MDDLSKKVVIAKPLVILREEFDDRAILFDPDTGHTFAINPIGVLVWKRLNGLNNLADIAQEVCQRAAGVPSDVVCHIGTFVQTAVDLGLAAYEVE